MIKQILLIVMMVVLSSCSSKPDITQFKAPINKEIQRFEETQDIVEWARQGQVLALKNAIDQGVSINTLAAGDSPFSAALKQGRLRTAKYLLTLDADWRLGFESQPANALMLAAQQGANALVELLLTKGAAVNTQDADGYTALAKAAINGELATIKVLANAGGDVNIPAQGLSVMMLVLPQNNMLLVQLLIDLGADLQFRSPQGETALAMARKQGLADVGLLLVNAGGAL